jgi:hypothetical protein
MSAPNDSTNDVTDSPSLSIPFSKSTIQCPYGNLCNDKNSCEFLHSDGDICSHGKECLILKGTTKYVVTLGNRKKHAKGCVHKDADGNVVDPEVFVAEINAMARVAKDKKVVPATVKQTDVVTNRIYFSGDFRHEDPFDSMIRAVNSVKVAGGDLNCVKVVRTLMTSTDDKYAFSMANNIEKLVCLVSDNVNNIVKVVEILTVAGQHTPYVISNAEFAAENSDDVVTNMNQTLETRRSVQSSGRGGRGRGSGSGRGRGRGGGRGRGRGGGYGDSGRGGGRGRGRGGGGGYGDSGRGRGGRSDE